MEFKSQWAAGPNTKVAFQNVEFNKPKNGESWVRFNILQGGGNQASIGAAVRQYRHVGVITVQVFVKENGGSRAAKSLCDSAGNIFRGKSFEDDNIVCRAPGITEVGSDDGWYQVNVDIPFYWDEFV